MKRAGVWGAIAAAGLFAVVSLAASSDFAVARATESCGNVAGVPVHAHDISCRTARRIYRANMNGNLPSGWSCSASLARCYRGEVGASNEYMWWKRTVYRARPGSVVLGGEVYGGPNGQGWGEPHPSFIYNGGDASGSIDDVTWSSWGGTVAHGRGRHPIFKPRGGYYRHSVVALLKATELGRCEGRPAYLRLLIREPRRPGGPLGPWRSWAGPQTLCEPYGSSFGRPSSRARIGFTSCGSPFGGVSIIQRGTSCTQARKVMQKVYVKSQEVAPVNGVLYARGWSCTLNTSQKRAITCRRGDGVIKGPTPG
jgi:hypothetical protein